MIRDDFFWHSEPSYDLIEYEQRCCLAILLERRHGLLFPSGVGSNPARDKAHIDA